MQTTKDLLTFLLTLYKSYGKELQIIKIMVLIIVNVWLLIIFWKILLIENINVVGHNVALTKMQTMLGPILQILGLDMLSPSTIKMVMVTCIVLGVNITILHFNTVVLMVIPLGLARYGYKMYTNYLINSENLAKIGYETLKTEVIAPKVVEQAPLIINTGSASGTNWWLWGTVIVVGAIAVGAVVLTIWSHNTNANNMADLADNTATSLNNLNNTINDVNRVNITLKSQIDLNSITTREYVKNINDHFDLIENKIDNNLQAVEVLKNNYEKITKLSNENTLELSQKSLTIAEKAASTIQEMSEITSATEGVIVGVAKFYDIIKDYGERLSLVETKMESITGGTTPRGMFKPITRLNNVINPNANE